MSKYFARAFGGYKEHTRLVVIDIESIEAKKAPHVDHLIVECTRGDRNIRTKEIEVDGRHFPLSVNYQLALTSVFYVDDKHKV
jgi:hypothetical protein